MRTIKELVDAMEEELGEQSYLNKAHMLLVIQYLLDRGAEDKKLKKLRSAILKETP